MSRTVVLAGLALAGLLVLATWRFASSPGDPASAPTPTATPTARPTADDPDAAPSETAAAAPTPSLPKPGAGTPPGPTASPGSAPSPRPTEVAPPTPSPAAPLASAPPLVGVADIADDQGDLLDTAGRPPPREEPAADLVGVRLEGDGDELVVTWSLAGDVPASTGSLVWSLDVWADGTQHYTATVQQIGGRRLAGVLDWGTGEQHAPGEPVVDGRSVTVRLPAALLERVDGPFQWQALGQVDGGYEDYVPADGTLTWFPAADP